MSAITNTTDATEAAIRLEFAKKSAANSASNVLTQFFKHNIEELAKNLEEGKITQIRENSDKIFEILTKDNLEPLQEKITQLYLEIVISDWPIHWVQDQLENPESTNPLYSFGIRLSMKESMPKLKSAVGKEMEAIMNNWKEAIPKALEEVLVKQAEQGLEALKI